MRSEAAEGPSPDALPASRSGRVSGRRWSRSARTPTSRLGLLLAASALLATLPMPQSATWAATAGAHARTVDDGAATAPAEDDHGDTPETATRIALREYVRGWFDSGDDVDYFRFEVPRDADIARWRELNTHEHPQVLDPEGREIEPEFGDRWARPARYRLSAGEYVVRMGPQPHGIVEPYGFGFLEDIPVEIPAPHLRSAIEAVMRPGVEPPFTSGDLAARVLAVRFYDGGGVADLSGLEWAVQLHTVQLNSHDLTSIAPLSGLDALRTVILRDNRIEDLSPLSAAPALHGLHVDGNRIADLAPLANVKALDTLTLERNRIADITPLRDLTQLVRLRASHNQIAEVSALSRMDGLRALALASNRIGDVSALAGLTGLADLVLADNAIADIGPLGALKSLRGLDIGGNGVADLAPLRELTDLRKLDVRHNPLSAESRDVHIPALQAAGVSVTWINDDLHGDTRETPTQLVTGQGASGRIAPYYDTDFFRLDVDETAVFDVFTTGPGPLQGRLLDADGRELATGNADAATANFLIRRRLPPGAYYIEVTAHYDPFRIPARYSVHAATDAVDVEIPDPALRAALEELLHKEPGETITSGQLAVFPRLRFASRGIADLTGLEFATGLTELYLENNDISDLGPLTGLPRLAHLFLQRNRIADISPLATLTELRTLDLGHNEIEDLSPIVNLPRLEWLNVSNNPLGQESQDVHLATLQDNGVDVQEPDDMHGDELDTATPLALGDVVHGRIHPDYDLDVFRIELDRSVRVGLLVTRQGLRLLDEAGVRLAEGQPLPSSISRIIQARLDPGTYYVEVRGGGEYTLRAIHAVNVAFSDPGLAAAVNRALERGPGATVTAAEMAAVGWLNACCSGIVDLTGIELAASLGHLNLSHNEITDLTPLAGLSRLYHLDLTGNEIVDLAPLAELPLLRHLAAADNRIRDVSPLEGLESLSWLDLGGNEIEDIAPLTRMASLSRLQLWSNPLSDESVERHVPALVNRLVRVEYLDDHGDAPEAATRLVLDELMDGLISPYYDRDWFELEITRAWDIVFASRYVTFRLVDAKGTELGRAGPPSQHRVHRLSRRLAPGTYFVEVSGVARASGFYQISAAEIAPVPDAELRAALRERLRKDSGDEVTIREMADVTHLDAIGYGIRSIAGLDFAPRLQRLRLSRNRIADLSPLENLADLRELWLADNEIADIASLAGLTDLTRLDLARNAIDDIRPLAGLVRLEHLDLSDNLIEDVAPLEALAELSHLNLNGNTIGDISVVASLTALAELHLSHNAIRDISPLAALRALRQLDLSDNRVADIGALAELASLTFLDLRRNPLNSRAAEVLAPFIRRGADVGVVDDHDDDPANATALTFGDTVTGRLEPTGDHDHFRLEVSEDLDAVFFTTGDLDTAGALLDVDGRQLATGFNTGARQSQLPVPLHARSRRVPPAGNRTTVARIRGDLRVDRACERHRHPGSGSVPRPGAVGPGRHAPHRNGPGPPAQPRRVGIPPGGPDRPGPRAQPRNAGPARQPDRRHRAPASHDLAQVRRPAREPARRRVHRRAPPGAARAGRVGSHRRRPRRPTRDGDGPRQERAGGRHRLPHHGQGRLPRRAASAGGLEPVHDRRGRHARTPVRRDRRTRRPGRRRRRGLELPYRAQPAARRLRPRGERPAERALLRARPRARLRTLHRPRGGTPATSAHTRGTRLGRTRRHGAGRDLERVRRRRCRRLSRPRNARGRRRDGDLRGKSDAQTMRVRGAAGRRNLHRHRRGGAGRRHRRDAHDVVHPGGYAPLDVAWVASRTPAREHAGDAVCRWIRRGAFRWHEPLTPPHAIDLPGVQPPRGINRRRQRCADRRAGQHGARNGTLLIEARDSRTLYRGIERALKRRPDDADLATQTTWDRLADVSMKVGRHHWTNAEIAAEGRRGRVSGWRPRPVDRTGRWPYGGRLDARAAGE